MLHFKHSRNKHTFLPAFGSGGKEEQITNRPSFFAIDVGKRESGQQTDHPFFLHFMQKERMSGQQTDHPFFLQLMQKERTSVQQGDPQHRQTLANSSINIGSKAKTYLECFQQPSFQ